MNPLNQSLASNTGLKNSSNSTDFDDMNNRESLSDVNGIVKKANNDSNIQNDLEMMDSSVSNKDSLNVEKPDMFKDQNTIQFSLEQVILADDSLYVKALFFGLIWFRNRNGGISFPLCCWNLFLITTSLVGVGFFIFLPAATTVGVAGVVVSSIGALLQYTFNAVIVYYAQKICKHSLRIPKIDGFNVRCGEIMDYSFKGGIIFLFLQVIFIVIAANVKVSIPPKILAIALVSFIPLCVMLSGLVVIAVADLQFQRLYTTTVVDMMDAQTLTEKGYYCMKELLDEKEKTSPINFILAMGIVGLVAAIFAIAALGGPAFFCSIFLRILIGMVPIVYEIIRVNDLTDKMSDIIFDEKWSKPELSSTRIGLFMAITQKPLMVTILGQQPSSTQIYSTIFAAVVSFGASIILKQVGISGGDDVA